MSGIAGIGGGQTNWPNLSAVQQNLFANIDSNKDGQISPDELTAFGQNLPSTQNAGAGGTADPTALFSQIDSDGNGTISKDELTAFGNKLSASNNSSLLQAQEGTGGAGRAHHHHHHGGGGSSSASQSTDPTSLFNQIDTDQDGVISAQEWAAQFSTSDAASAYSTMQSDGQSSLDPLLQLVDKLIG